MGGELQRVLATYPLHRMSWLFAFSIPFMLVAIAIAVMPLVYTMVKDRHGPAHENESFSNHSSKEPVSEGAAREVVRAGR